jgi:hypothetical protein
MFDSEVETESKMAPTRFRCDERISRTGIRARCKGDGESGVGTDCVACSYVWSRGAHLRQQIAKSKKLRSDHKM